MNIDFAATGGTAMTVAGATIFACERAFDSFYIHPLTTTTRWGDKDRCCPVSRAA